jgi:hypothetical protein
VCLDKALHEAVLPRAAFVASTELDFQPHAELVVLVAQVFTALVAV